MEGNRELRKSVTVVYAYWFVFFSIVKNNLFSNFSPFAFPIS